MIDRKFAEQHIHKHCFCKANEAMYYYFFLNEIGDFSIIGIQADDRPVTIAYDEIRILRPMKPREKEGFMQRRAGDAK